ncbi:MAG: hypothetical protein PHZ07_00315 [Patescibacteria group bacterium]|nr:hypothetical protein [Patescibacteria group bacterium]MDD4304169.1 hypothetical protein [Patescibacteria group bacterium]MDD4695201.1 hypothetical protein [Patescibacteria group bacterium]
MTHYVKKSKNLLHQLQQGGLCIAIIDDNLGDLELLKYALQKIDIPNTSILVFHDDYKELLKAVESNQKIVAIISDLEMTETNGFVLLKKLKSIFYPGAFIIYSGCTETKIQEMKDEFLHGVDFSTDIIVLEKTSSMLHNRHQIKEKLESLLYV